MCKRIQAASINDITSLRAVLRSARQSRVVLCWLYLCQNQCVASCLSNATPHVATEVAVRDCRADRSTARRHVTSFMLAATILLHINHIRWFCCHCHIIQLLNISNSLVSLSLPYHAVPVLVRFVGFVVPAISCSF